MFDKIPERDIVAWNSMIVNVTRSGLNAEAIKMFYQVAEPTQGDYQVLFQLRLM